MTLLRSVAMLLGAWVRLGGHCGTSFWAMPLLPKVDHLYFGHLE